MNNASTEKRIVIMAGGTGGHVFPGLAVADYMREQQWKVHWFGTADKMEAQLVPNKGYPIHFLSVHGVRGKTIMTKLLAPFMLLRAVWHARRILQSIDPHVVLGMGGFASGPGGIAAISLRIPLVVHEQNAVFGLTNRWLSKFAKRVLCGFDHNNQQTTSRAPRHTEYVGNPVRNEFKDLSTAFTKPLNNTFHILVVGGSLGALALNQQVPQALLALRQEFALNIVHQSGKDKLAAVKEAYQGQDNVHLVEFIDDMPAQFAQADIIICRSGALSVAEVAAAGKAAIFVPLPIAVDDHQTYNAQALSAHQAAILLPQAQLASSLYDVLHQLLSQPEKLHAMSTKAADYYHQDATHKVALACAQVCAKELS